jgi:hypothetical protein
MDISMSGQSTLAKKLTNGFKKSTLANNMHLLGSKKDI